MEEKARRRRLGASAGKAILTGALAAALVPAMAFAATTAADKMLAQVPDGAKSVQWPDGQWSTYDAANGNYVWSTYVKGDGGHYGHYDLDVAFTVDESTGTLTAIDVTSPGGVVGGKWAEFSTIVGSLPQGVSNETVVDAAAKTVKPAFTVADGVDYGGISVTGVSFYQATADDLGQAYAAATISDGKAAAAEADAEGAYSYATLAMAQSNGKRGYTYTVPAEQPTPNVVGLTVKVGDWYSFTVYQGIGDGNAELAAGLNASLATDYDSDTVSGIGAKNREMWTQAAYASIIEQQLGEFVDDPDYDLDIVTSATKSSDAVIEALYASQGVYYPISNNEDAASATPPAGWKDEPIFTKVADDLSIELDGTKVNTGASSVQADGGVYRVTSNFSEGFVLDKSDPSAPDTAVNIIGYDVYDMSGYAGDATKHLLSDATQAYSAITDTTSGRGESAVVTSTKEQNQAAFEKKVGAKPLASVLVKESYGNHLPLKELTAAGGATGISSYDPDTNTVTVTDPSATHVIVWYNHDTHNNYFGVVYALPANDEPAATVVDLSKATVTLAKASAAYNGKSQQGAVASVVLDGKTLVAGTDYTVSAQSGKAAGGYAVTVTGTGAYTGTATATFTIAKAKNPVKAAGKTATVKYSKVKKKAQTLKASQVVKVSKVQGKVAYEKASGNKKIAVSKSGKVTVKKGLKKGTYKVKVKVTAAGNGNYGKATKTVTFKVKVK